VTIVSGEWLRDPSDAQLTKTGDDVSLDVSGLCEPVEPDSPEGQLILVEVVRSLEKRLSPEARVACAGQSIPSPIRAKRISFYFKLQSFFQFICFKALSFCSKGK
jgi:hypothetical protein